ncbi:hypothetical protein [Bacillus sp. AFS040349]|nr:hypothetical protein [Bacillus sp. AFS040349]
MLVSILFVVYCRIVDKLGEIEGEFLRIEDKSPEIEGKLPRIEVKS